MKASEIWALSDEELNEKLNTAYEELFNLRFRLASKQLQDTNSLKRARRDIARIKMVLRQRQLAQGGVAPSKPA